MIGNIGLWLDHKKAVIVSKSGDEEVIKTITSGMEKHARFSGEAQKNSEEDIQERRFTNHLNRYYDEIVSTIKEAKALFIMGPGEAKLELKKRLEKKNQFEAVVAIETADKMTDPQIAAKYREHFSS